MSNVSNRHTLIPFEAGKTAPLTGQRLAKIGYKTTAKNPAKFKNAAVSVPPVTAEMVEPHTSELMPYIIGLVETAQDGIIRGLYESADGAMITVSDDEISVESCVAYLRAEAAGDRLKKEHILAWFADEVNDALFVLIAEKLKFGEPNEDQAKVVQQHVNGYRDVFASLAGNRTAPLNDLQRKNCKLALSLVDTESGVGAKILAKITEQEKPVVVKELIDLE